jgi:hypothetical protein
VRRTLTFMPSATRIVAPPSAACRGRARTGGRQVAGVRGGEGARGGAEGARQAAAARRNGSRCARRRVRQRLPPPSAAAAGSPPRPAARRAGAERSGTVHGPPDHRSLRSVETARVCIMDPRLGSTQMQVVQGRARAVGYQAVAGEGISATSSAAAPTSRPAAARSYGSRSAGGDVLLPSPT